MAKVESGSLDIAVIGGSFSSPFSEHGEDVWFNQLHQGLTRWLPNVRVTAHNGALGSSNIVMGRMCLNAMIPDNVDVVFVEYNPNTNPFSCTGPEIITRWCKEFELLVRKILLHPNKPELVLLTMMLPSHGTYHRVYTHSSEEGTTELANYYSVPMISMRNALWRLQQLQVQKYSDNTTRWHAMWPDPEKHLWHFNKIGNKYVADLAMHFFETMVNAPELAHPEEETLVGLGSLIPNNTIVPTTLICAYNKQMLRHSELEFTAPAGRRWKFEHDTRQKYGFVTRRPDTTLKITWSSSTAQFTPDAYFHVWVGYFYSYVDEMGRAELTCEGGCACEPVAIDAHSEIVQSIIYFARLKLTQLADSCSVLIRALPHPRNNSTPYLFKVNGFMVTKCTGGEACTVFPAELQADIA